MLQYNKIFSYGGNSSNLQSFLTSNIKDIIKTEKAFCALNNDGKIITWGHSNYGGDYKHKYDEITDISSISSNIYSMAAISKTGKLYTWGEYGRYHNNQWAGLTSTNYKKDMTDSSAYESKVNSGVTDVYYNDAAGIAIKDDGNGFTEGRVFSYWVDEQKGFQSEIATFQEISDIKVEYADDTLSNTTVTIIRSDDTEFMLFISAIDGLDKAFVKDLKSRIKKPK